jgi:hypothetical protein
MKYGPGNLFVVVVVLGFELRTYTLSHSTSPFWLCVMGFFDTGSLELFCLGWL